MVSKKFWSATETDSLNGHRLGLNIHRALSSSTHQLHPGLNQEKGIRLVLLRHWVQAKRCSRPLSLCNWHVNWLFQFPRHHLDSDFLNAIQVNKCMTMGESARTTLRWDWHHRMVSWAAGSTAFASKQLEEQTRANYPAHAHGGVSWFLTLFEVWLRWRSTRTSSRLSRAADRKSVV